MIKLSFLIFALLLAPFLFAQSSNAWVRFVDTSANLCGYKDPDGTVRIPARLETMTRADSFYNIMAVAENAGERLEYYYLLKDGRKVGKDSLYVFDFTFDCESEGKILFKDRKRDRVGFLDQNGVAVIPAIYNYATPFRNGLAVALRNAKRACWDDHGDTTTCEHLGWDGGEMILINAKNEVLADSVAIEWNTLDWYSMRVNDPSVDTSLFVSIRGRGGAVYSFLDYTKEFTQWFYRTFLPALQSKDEHRIEGLLFPEVTSWTNKEGWKGTDKDLFSKRFSRVLSAERFTPNKLKEITIGDGMLNELIFDKPVYKKYMTACGEHNRDRFPQMEVLITYYKQRQKPLQDVDSEFLRQYETGYQENFEFLRTEDGYKLLCVSVSD